MIFCFYFSEKKDRKYSPRVSNSRRTRTEKSHRHTSDQVRTRNGRAIYLKTPQNKIKGWFSLSHKRWSLF